LLAGLVIPMVIALAQHAHAQGAERPQGHANGRVIDTQSNAPVANVELVLRRAVDTATRARSDSLGRFSFTGALGDQLIIEARRFGYQPVSVHWTVGGADTSIVIGMVPVPLVLTPVAVAEQHFVSPRLAGFELRARSKGGGTFIQREQMDAWHPRQTSDLMRRVLGVKLVDSSGILLAASSRGQKVDLKTVNTARAAGPCIMRIGVDGQIKEWGFAMDMVDPNSIHGIEVYNGPASIPSEFSGMRTDSFCGLVMIWTRSGR
jgi:hypothetical protein